MADNINNAPKQTIEEFLANDEKKDLLRFLTAGSVDDGKSTLIGRLLFDSKKIYEDQLDALERDSKRIGNAGEHIDYALLLDGLKAEREQGITIDVAYHSRVERFDVDDGTRQCLLRVVYDTTANGALFGVVHKFIGQDG